MLRVAFALLFGWIALPMAQAQTPAEAAPQLAARIASLLQRRATVSLELQNLTQLQTAELSSFRSAFEEELRKLGFDPAAQPEIRLRVTLSENSRGLLFVAEAVSGDTRQVAMLPWAMTTRIESKPRMKLTMQPIWEQPEPLLDLLLLDSGSTMLVLGAGKITSYRSFNGRWTLAGVATIPTNRPVPRDPRGKLEMNSNGIHVYIPGTTCGATADLKLTCTPGNEAWRAVRWQTDRNTLESDGQRAAFYSNAAGLIAASDGRVQDRNGEQVPGTDGWGSDLTTLDNPCGSAEPAVIASKAASGRDELQAYDLVSGLPRPVSEPLVFAGPVTALWQSTVVIRNSKTGNYEASRLGLACAE